MYLKLFNILLYTLILPIFLISCAGNKRSMNFESVTPEVANKYAIYAMMASNSYQDIDDLRFPLEIINWNLIHSVSDDSGLAFDIFEKEKSNEVVFAFRGTELWDLGDHIANFTYFLTSQPKNAQKYLEKYMLKYCNKHIILTGHSLGGGLALGMSLRLGLDAITFNPSPRLYDGIGSYRPYNEKADRVIVFQEGELLESFRDKMLERVNFISSTKSEKIVPENNFYKIKLTGNECNDSICKHSMIPLALKLLKDSNNSNMEKICKAIKCQKNN